MRCLCFLISLLLDSAHGGALFDHLTSGLGILFVQVLIQHAIARGALDGGESSSVTANFVPLQHCELFQRFAGVDSNMRIPPGGSESFAVRTVVEALLARVSGWRDLDGFEFCLPYTLTRRERMFCYDGVGGRGHVMVL